MTDARQDRAAAAWRSRAYPFQEDMAFQRRTWRVERAGWLALSIIVVLGLLGVFADGPLSSDSRSDATGRLWVEYERFYRDGASGAMRWRVDSASGEETTIVLDTGFTDAFTIETVTPEPDRMSSTHEGIAMTFLHETDAALSVSLAVRATSVGPAVYDVGLAGEPPLRLRSLVYP